MVVVMLSADDPSAARPLACSPRRGMDCVDKTSTANKKLVQARLPFKRLNPVPKGTGQAKRTRTVPSAPLAHEPSASDGENEADATPTPVQPSSSLRNGRGPLDGFLRWTKCPSVNSALIDLTQDSNSTDSQTQPSTPVDVLSSTGEATKTTQNATETNKSEEASLVPVSPKEASPVSVSSEDVSSVPLLSEEAMEPDEAEDRVAVPQLNSTLESETETQENQKQPQETEECLEMESLLSTSSVSLVESSPEPDKSRPTTPASVPRVNTEQKQSKRRSLKNAQEQEDKQRQREEKERQKEEARAVKEKKREEARRMKEELKKEKQEKKEKEEKERREKREKQDKEKAERQQAKEEQRKVKIEAKLEEKRKKEEEKRLKEEKERIKAEKAVITRFLQKPKPQLAPKTLASVCGKFAPFEIKKHMALAPLTRVQCEEAVLEELDRYLTEPDVSLDCLNDWITHKPRKSGPTKHTATLRDCVVVDVLKTKAGHDHKRYGRVKLLQFHENYRPAYWGTWSKKSAHISPRCPFKLDKDLLDYEVDSDEEWEEEEPGESLSHSEGDDDEEGDDDDEDDGFFVPHGYLSDGEGAREDEEGGDPEKQKVLQKLKAREWDELMAKRKLNVLAAVVKGCIWEGEDPPPDMLQPYAVCLLEPLKNEESNTPEENTSRQQRNHQWLSQLLPLLHGNVNSSKVIITEFQEFCRQQLSSMSGSPQSPADSIPPRIRVKRLIKENAVYEKQSTYRRCCWYVYPDVLARFGHEALPVPCQWTYLIPGVHTARDESTLSSQNSSPTAVPHSTSTTPSNKRKSGNNQSITKYMKRCGEPEQTEAMETDGFQADTEDDDDDDCIILCEQSEPSEQNSQVPRREAKNTEAMDTVISLPCPTPATA